jgi:ribose 5-phosphate isomerase RpiB
LLAGIDSKAILGGGSRQGDAMVANRFKGVHCAVYYGPAREQTDTLDMLAFTREHNYTNALSIGG